MFGTILISIITCMHIYVFWRLASIPLISRHVSKKILIGAGVVLWTVFFLGRAIGHHGTGTIAKMLEFCGMNWMAILFLIFIPLFLIDIVTLFGLIMRRFLPLSRLAAVIVGVLLSAAALVQGLRPPVITPYEVHLAGLPRELDNTVIVAMSDMHLGSLLGREWLNARIDQVRAQRADLILLLGDIFEGHGPPEADLIAQFKTLSAPLGTWAVSGNHEFHGMDRLAMLEKSGFGILNNKWVEPAPGLILSGVDDLTAWRRNGKKGDPIAEALGGRPAGATIFLSHTPTKAKRIADAGVGLMLSGHTHGGQIWPFDYLVQLRYPLLEGRYEVGAMTAIVSRGAGTWGPRMRLFEPGEILRVTLRAK